MNTIKQLAQHIVDNLGIEVVDLGDTRSDNQFKLLCVSCNAHCNAYNVTVRKALDNFKHHSGCTYVVATQVLCE